MIKKKYKALKILFIVYEPDTHCQNELKIAKLIQKIVDLKVFCVDVFGDVTTEITYNDTEDNEKLFKFIKLVDEKRTEILWGKKRQNPQKNIWV